MSDDYLIDRLEGWVQDIRLGGDAQGADLDILEAAARIRELEAERDALVAEAYQAAALIPMDRLAKGKGISPINISAAIQNLTPADAISARAARDKQVREEALRRSLAGEVE